MLCPDCKTPYYPAREELHSLGLPPQDGTRLYRAVGCDRCYDSGYKGRVGLYEILPVNQALQALVLERPTLDRLREHRQTLGLASLYDEGREKVLEGLAATVGGWLWWLCPFVSAWSPLFDVEGGGRCAGCGNGKPLPLHR